MKTYLLLAAAVLASPPKPDATGSVPVTDPRALPLPDQPASAEASHPITRFPSTTGAPRQITPGVSP